MKKLITFAVILYTVFFVAGCGGSGGGSGYAGPAIVINSLQDVIA